MDVLFGFMEVSDKTRKAFMDVRSSINELLEVLGNEERSRERIDGAYRGFQEIWLSDEFGRLIGSFGKVSALVPDGMYRRLYANIQARYLRATWSYPDPAEMIESFAGLKTFLEVMETNLPGLNEAASRNKKVY